MVELVTDLKDDEYVAVIISNVFELIETQKFVFLTSKLLKGKK